MPPVLDTESYPHFLDAILAYASRDALLRLRTVSRDLRRRADAQLMAGHILICGDGLPYIPRAWHVDPSHLLDASALVTSADGLRIPAFASWGQAVNHTAHNTPPYRGSPTYDDYLDAVRRRKAALEADLQYTQIVDVIGERPLRDPRAFAILLKPHLTLRFMLNLTGERYINEESLTRLELSATVDTYVLFIPLPYMFYEDRGFFPRPHSRRAVANISVNALDAVYGNITGGASLPSCSGFDHTTSEAVWIFHSAKEPTSCGEGLRDPALTGTLECSDLLSDVAAAIVNTLRYGTATIVVGLEAEALETWLDASGVNGTRQEQFRAYCREPLGDHDEAILNDIEFLSLDEYRAKVGPKRSALETRENAKYAKYMSPDA